MPTESAKASSRPRVGQTPLDITSASPAEWSEAEQKVREPIRDRQAATGFWIKTKEPVGRAELKLAGAVDAFQFDFTGRVVMDVGSSTGGFTELALSRGATRVIAIEKGTNQMKEPLRSLPAVELHEKTDVFTVKPELAQDVQIYLIDVSFTSVRPVLTYIKSELIEKNQVANPTTENQAVARMGQRTPVQAQEIDIIAMLKPQFEARPQDLVRGVIKNEKIRRRITKEFEDWTRRKGFVIINKHDSDLPGKSGNIERFYWLRMAKG